MNKLFIIAIILLSGVAQTEANNAKLHSSKSRKKYSITHYNITFTPDLSNRVNPNIYRRPLNDVDLLRLLADNLYPSILRFHRSENQKDKIRIDFINKGLINEYRVNTDKLAIDFGHFNNQNARIDYIMERNGVKKTLKRDVKDLIGEFAKINAAASTQNFGADIWTYFNEGLDESVVIPDEKLLRDEDNTYVNTYRNVLILTTDGYIEAGIYGKGFDLSKKTIDNFRQAFLASGSNDLSAFFKKNKQFKIQPVKNEKLRHLEVLVMELYDRSRSKVGAATIHPTDMEIMQLYWADWLKQSGVMRFELHPFAKSKAEAEKTILDFLNVEKKETI